MLWAGFLSSAVKQAFKQVRKRAPAPRFSATFLVGFADSFTHLSGGRVGFSPHPCGQTPLTAIVAARPCLRSSLSES